MDGSSLSSESLKHNVKNFETMQTIGNNAMAHNASKDKLMKEFITLNPPQQSLSFTHSKPTKQLKKTKASIIEEDKIVNLTLDSNKNNSRH